MAQPKLSASMFIGVSGKDIISFGSGQPDLPPPKGVFKAFRKYKDFRYGLIQGNLNLREALVEEYPKSKADSFVITNGASEALDLSLRVIANMGKRGGRVLLCRPYYYSYLPLVRFAGLTPVFTDLVDGRIDFADFQKKVQICKAVIINSPSNPTGRVEAIETLKKIEKLTSKLGTYVLSDEVYKELIYERENYLIKGPHVVTINSFSKTYNMCGLRVGYLWSLDKELIQGVIEIKTHSSMNTNGVAQEMAYEALKTPRSFITQQVGIWKQRRDFIYRGLLDMGLDVWRPEGAFYVLPKVKNPRTFVWDMFKKYKVITYLGEWFGADDRVRFSYALDIKKIEDGLHRVRKYLASKREI